MSIQEKIIKAASKRYTCPVLSRFQRKYFIEGATWLYNQARLASKPVNRTKVVIAENGQFSLSYKGLKYLLDHKYPFTRKQRETISIALSMMDREFFYTFKAIRHHPVLVQCVEALGGKEAGGFKTELAVKTITGDKYRVVEQDEIEHIETPFTVDWTEL